MLWSGTDWRGRGRQVTSSNLWKLTSFVAKERTILGENNEQRIWHCYQGFYQSAAAVRMSIMNVISGAGVFLTAWVTLIWSRLKTTSGAKPIFGLNVNRTVVISIFLFYMVYYSPLKSRFQCIWMDFHNQQVSSKACIFPDIKVQWCSQLTKH